MDQKTKTSSPSITLWDLFQSVNNIYTYLLSKWKILFFTCFIGGLLGLSYSFLQPVKYVAKLNFVVEDGKSGGGGLASLAGQFGFDLGGSTTGGVFSGDNILLFLKSEGLIRETLMTNYDEKGEKTLADQFIALNKPKFFSSNQPGKKINFKQYQNQQLPRKEDSLMQVLVNTIRKTELSITKPDKKASFIEVHVATKDELLSKYFVERLVSIATNRYVEWKTKVKASNVNNLQRKADSLSAVLTDKTYVAASNQQTLVDVNPALRTAPIQSEISAREKNMTATIFAEVVKNLEISRSLLSQETPVIQVVDQSTLPLPKIWTSKSKSAISGAFIAFLLSSLYLLYKRWVNKNGVSQL